MSHAPLTSQFRRDGVKRRRGLSLIVYCLQLVFIRGPKVLFTSQITGLCGALMIMLCSPSLLYCAMLTIPGAVFNSPEQNAYFYFSKILNEDPGRWIVLVVAAACTLFALALPATMPEKPMPLRY